jgi:hypothetical protein
MAALYVSPFLSACEELQSRIYKILELGGLDALRQRYPDGAYAEETLYLMVRFFGWSAAVNRYGPYTQDPQVIGLVTSIRRAFSTSSTKRPVGPFNFFKELLGAAPLSDSVSVKQTLDALRTAKDVSDIAGRERLADAQNHIVDLLSYLEASEGYSLFGGQRSKCALTQSGSRIANKRSRPSLVSEPAQA